MHYVFRQYWDFFYSKFWTFGNGRRKQNRLDISQCMCNFDIFNNHLYFTKKNQGCWNIYGYLGDLNGGKYATKDGLQMRVIKNMISKILGQDF